MGVMIGGDEWWFWGERKQNERDRVRARKMTNDQAMMMAHLKVVAGHGEANHTRNHGRGEEANDAQRDSVGVPVYLHENGAHEHGEWALQKTK